jgi:DNA topoisomerase I
MSVYHFLDHLFVNFPNKVYRSYMEELIKSAKKANLCYVSDSSPGFFREKSEKNIKYYDLKGKTIKDTKTLKRIKELVIPPAWKNVWVSPRDDAHLQATGIDEKGRKQYIYHKDWVRLTQENKFSKLVDFGLSLPKIRSKISYDLQSDKMDKRKILATVVWLLEHTFIRIGNEEYMDENNSYGLTTLRNKHVTIRGPKISLRFIGKKGVLNVYEISNPKIAKTIKRCIELPGYQIFQFLDENGDKQVVDSEDVNLFLKDVTKDDFTAKDFRTWGGTFLSASQFHKLGNPSDEASLKQNIVTTVKSVASHLNNTVSVCKNYYIHPTVIKTYSDKILVPHFDSHKNIKQNGLTWEEHALIKLLQKYA